MEVVKECEEISRDVAEFNRHIDNDISHIDSALWQNDVNEMQKCERCISSKYTKIFRHLYPNQQLLLVREVCNDTNQSSILKSLLVAQKEALQNIKKEYKTSQLIEKGKKLGDKWKEESKWTS